MATIRKRRFVSGELVWELTHGTGRDRVRMIVGRTREEAQVALDQFNRQLALHGAAPDDDVVEAVLGRYLTFLRHNRRPGTVRRYERVLTTFFRCYLAVEHPHVRRLRQIRPVHLEDYKYRRSDGGVHEVPAETATAREVELRRVLAQRPGAEHPKDNARFGWLGRKHLRPTISQKSVNYELQVLQTFFGWAMGRNYLTANPATPVERYRVRKQALPKFLTAEQLNRLFAACEEPERSLFTAILLTGMRKGEVEHLTWADVNFDLGVVLIQAKPEWRWAPKTDERVIPMSPALRQLLTRRYDTRTNDGLVFPNQHGNRDTHILQKLQQACRRAGIPKATVHALRHSFGAHLRMAGVSLADIADLLGHKDLATTQIYAKVHQEHLRTVVAKLAPRLDLVDVGRPDEAARLPSSARSSTTRPSLPTTTGRRGDSST